MRCLLPRPRRLITGRVWVRRSRPPSSIDLALNGFQICCPAGPTLPRVPSDLHLLGQYASRSISNSDTGPRITPFSST